MNLQATYKLQECEREVLLAPCHKSSRLKAFVGFIFVGLKHCSIHLQILPSVHTLLSSLSTSGRSKLLSSESVMWKGYLFRCLPSRSQCATLLSEVEVRRATSKARVQGTSNICLGWGFVICNSSNVIAVSAAFWTSLTPPFLSH